MKLLLSKYTKQVSIALIVGTILYGAYLRFKRIENKPIWFDEVYTVVLSSGESIFSKDEKLSKMGVLTALQFNAVLDEFRADNLSVISNLINEDPKHSPIFYLLSNFTHRTFKCAGRYSTRYTSAFLSLFLGLAVFSLSRELSQSKYSPLLAAIFATISPLNIIYSQEGREYGFLTVLAIIAGFLLLKAVQQKAKIFWILYTLTSVISVFTHIFYWIVSLGHLIFVIAAPIKNKSNVVKNLIMCNSFVGILYSPWLYLMLRSHVLQEQLTAVPANFSILEQLVISLTSGSLMFFHPNLIELEMTLSDTIVAVAVSVFVVYAIYKFIKIGSTKSKVYIGSAIVAQYIVFGILYIVGAKNIFLVFKYFLVVYNLIVIGVVIGITNFLSGYLLTQGNLFKDTVKKSLNTAFDEKQVAFIMMGFLALLITSLSSVYSYQNSTNWWTKWGEEKVEELAKDINRNSGTYLISESFIPLFGISHYLKDSVRVLIVKNKKDLENHLLDPRKVIFLFTDSTQQSVNMFNNTNYTANLCRSSGSGRVYKFTPKIGVM